MNSCVLMVEIISVPELRYTSDNQTPVTKFTGQFKGLKEDEVYTIEVVSWGNLAQDVANYQQGQRAIVEGSLRMNAVDRSEGFKEKRAELNASRVHVDGGTIESPMPQTAKTPTPDYAPTSSKQARKPVAAAAIVSDDEEYDIPF